MRIPIPVAVLIAILVAAGFWWLRTRSMDFMTPTGELEPLPEFMTKPGLDDFRPDSAFSPPGAITLQPSTPAPDPALPALEFGDLESSPGLAEYSEFASKGAAYLIRLATELELQGEWERALLAWERVIDSCHPSDPERQTAEDSIVRIRPTLPHWNIDPAGDLPILLQLGTARQATDNLKAATQAVADFLRKDSDFTVLVTPRITTSPSRDAPADAPIAVYFSGTGETEAIQTDLLSISPQGDEQARYEAELLITAYQILRRHLHRAGGIVPPRPISDDGEKTKAEFTRQITRLHWLRFARSLVDPPPEDEN